MWLVMLLQAVFLTACVSAEKQPEDITTISQVKEPESREDKVREETEDLKQEEMDVPQPSEVRVAIADFSRPQESAAYASVPVAKQAAASQDDKIQHIRDIYNRTVGDQGSYRQSGGCYYTADGVLAKAVVSNGNAVLDEVMHKNGYTTYSLEYYYEDWSGGDGYPIFIYAVIDKKEYRYYFCQGEFIRRVGPESGGNTNDNPEMNAFIRTLLDQGASYRSQSATASAPSAESISDFSRPQESAAYSSISAAASQDDKIQHIRDIYNRTVGDQGSYRQSGGCYYTADGVLAKAVVSNGNAVLDEVMHKNGYTTYSLEYYYEDWSGGDGYPIFIYAVIDKKEYRYYFCQGEFIRRVGPESGGNTNDNPEMNAFIRVLLDEGASYR